KSFTHPDPPEIIKIPFQGKCHICKRVFCCGKCRQKHQFNTHAIAVRESLALPASNSSGESSSSSSTSSLSAGGIIEHRLEMEPGVTTIYVFCPICERRPLLLREEMHGELLAHIEACHLPLRCRKCQRNYTRIDDLREFSKCADQQQDCSGSSDLTCDTEASKITVKKAPAVVVSTTMSTQTSPAVTPISLFNMRWKAKRSITHEEYISDSVSSIRNLSSISNSSIRRSIGQMGGISDKGKVIRTTSTPLQVESMFAKPKEPITFNASGGGYVSSIYHEEPSPAIETNPHQHQHQHHQQQQQQPLQQRAWKMGARSKMSAVTPLRQVMSKSIQKAFVEHGGMLGQRRVRLDLSESNNYSSSEQVGGAGPGAGLGAGSAASSALDLRLSPAMRRTQSESSATAMQISSNSSQSSQTQQHTRQILLSAQKTTTESIIITRESSSTVYNSCESVEIIRSTSQSAEVHVPHGTPIRVSTGTGINKKQIKFETPGPKDNKENEEESREDFYTPNPGTPPERPERRRQAIVPRQLSGEFSPKKETEAKKDRGQVVAKPKPRPPLRECRQVKAFSGVQDMAVEPEDDEDEIFLPTNASTRNEKKQEPGTGSIWSRMSSMIRLPASLRGEKDANKENAGGSLIRRCASIAGSLVRPSRGDSTDKEEDVQSLKRKRTQTLDNQYCSPLSPSSSCKRYRIRPREPIERMRNT
ncbi:hypothetical protein KR067_010442, partial [Drosophila pandora]